jgi:hypothetical protein
MARLPGVATKTISDLIPYVVDALQNRTDVTPLLAARYIKRAVQEVCESNVFEELKITGPTVALTPGTVSYPVSTFMIDSGDDYVQIPSFAVFVDFPNNTIVSPIQYKVVMAIEPMLAGATVGVPSRWTRYGTNVLIGPNPNQAYSVFMRYQMRHRFPADESQMGGVLLYIPDTWEEIVAYAAAERIAQVKRWNEQATFIHQLLYGDPASQQKDGTLGRPGLIGARRLQIERDGQHNSRQLIPLVPRYGPR